MNQKLFKYSRIAEDICVDVLNNTLIKNGLAVHVEDVDNSISLLGKRGKSVMRWGDGESLILLKGDIYFQRYSPELRSRLLEIIKNYNDASPYFLCLPTEFLTCSTESLHALKKGHMSFYQMHKGTRYLYKRFFSKKTIYLSHFLFKGIIQSQFDRLLDLLSVYKAFVVVKSDSFIVRSFFSTFMEGSDFTTVTIPGKNAFQSYDSILENIIWAVNDFDFHNDEVLILLSAGPCAKVLAYDLSRQGLTSYDVGKFFECWLENIHCRV